MTWRQHALCWDNERVHEMMFPTQSQNLYTQSKHDKALAKRICAECLVQRECLEYAVEAQPGFGIWGGKTPTELKRLAVSAA